VTSYTTPHVGLSCRSMAMLMYACSQVLLMLLWLWDLALWRFNEDGSMKTSLASRPDLSVKTAWWYILVTLSIGMSLFTSVGGTSKSWFK